MSHKAYQNRISWKCYFLACFGRGGINGRKKCGRKWCINNWDNWVIPVVYAPSLQSWEDHEAKSIQEFAGEALKFPVLVLLLVLCFIKSRFVGDAEFISYLAILPEAGKLGFLNASATLWSSLCIHCTDRWKHAKKSALSVGKTFYYFYY